MTAIPPNRLPCLTEGCLNTIQPATAARTGGYCGPCSGKRNQAAWQTYVEANRKDLDRYAGITDPVQLLELMHTPPKHDPLVRLLPPPRTFEQIYLSLTPGEAQRLMLLAAEKLTGDEDVAHEIAKCLAAFTDYPLDTMLHAWLDRCEAYPSMIFRDAGARIRERLLKLLDVRFRQLDLDHLLSALAWIGGESVEGFFQDTEIDTPKWSRQLHIEPSAYARIAGWELVAGKRRNLTFGSCVALHVAGTDEQLTRYVRVMRDRSDFCPWCGRKLANLIEMTLIEPHLDAFHHLGSRVEVLTCPVCTCYGHVHAELDEYGQGHWAAGNPRPKYLPDKSESDERSPWSQVEVRLVTRRPIHAANWCLPTTLSQIGGLPAWVQDFDYPSCMKCGQTMMFLAQIDQAAFPRNEGVFYAFVCAACRTTATTYQQT